MRLAAANEVARLCIEGHRDVVEGPARLRRKLYAYYLGLSRGSEGNLALNTGGLSAFAS